MNLILIMKEIGVTRETHSSWLHEPVKLTGHEMKKKTKKPRNPKTITKLEHELTKQIQKFLQQGDTPEIPEVRLTLTFNSIRVGTVEPYKT